KPRRSSPSRNRESCPPWPVPPREGSIPPQPEEIDRHVRPVRQGGARDGRRSERRCRDRARAGGARGGRRGPRAPRRPRGGGRGEGVAKGIEAAGSRAIAAPYDVTSLEATLAGVAAIEARLGSVDVLVNNAGVPDGMGLVRFRDYDPAQWARMIDLNLYGVL